MHRLYLKWLVIPFFLLLGVVAVTVTLSDTAQAGIFGFATASVDTSCNRLQAYGFTVGLVYCVQASIGDATNKYVTAMQHNLKFFEGMAMMVAIALFGMKAMNSSLQRPLKEAMTFIIRMAIGVFFFTQAPNLYNWIAGIPPNGNGIITEAIGWVTGLSGGYASESAGGNGNLFSGIVTCTAPLPPYPFAGIQVWQAFDCMFSKMFGASTSSTAFYTSVLFIIGAALLSGTLGFTLAFLGLSMFLLALLLVIRALFLVLMTYITIGFMIILTPIVAPLLFFDSPYLTQIFQRWAGVILSSIMQPVFVIGYLGFAIAVDNQIISGHIPGCFPPTFPPAAGTVTTAPAGGYGQNGSGVCSFNDMTDDSGAGLPLTGTSLQKFFLSFLAIDVPRMSMGMHSDYQQEVLGGATPTGPTTGPKSPTDANAGGNTATVNALTGKGTSTPLQSPTGNGGGILGFSTTMLKSMFPTKQTLLTFLTFIFTTYILYSLMGIIPDMAINIVNMAGVNLYAAIKIPFEGVVGNALAGAEEGAASSTSQNVVGRGADSALASITRVVKTN